MNKDKTQFNGWTPKIMTSKSKIDFTSIPAGTKIKSKMLEICMSKNGSIEHINNLPKGYGYYIKKI